jgi:putative glycosyltransferase (TIGR04348 family)
MVRIVIVNPARAGIVTGNSVTAQRWRRILRAMGHQVRVVPELGPERLEVLIALHATKSAASVRRAASKGARIVVALTGTDLYQDLARLRRPWDSLALADRIVLLQPLGLKELTPELRQKSVVIRQSVPIPKGIGPRHRSRTSPFKVVVLSNLRQVKDPLRAAFASRMLPVSSRVRVIHAGESLNPSWKTRARAEMRRNPRYLWKGELTPAQARRLLSQGDLLVLSSRSEGGANVVSEAIVAGVPVLASDIPGNVGLLGRSYPGYFPVGDTRTLAKLIQRAEMDSRFYTRLQTHMTKLAPLFHPDRERAAWDALLEKLVRSR